MFRICKEILQNIDASQSDWETNQYKMKFLGIPYLFFISDDHEILSVSRFLQGRRVIFAPRKIT